MRPGDPHMHQWTRSLVQEMACRSSMPSHYLNQWRLHCNWIIRIPIHLIGTKCTVCFNEMHSTMSSTKYRPFCPDPKVVRNGSQRQYPAYYPYHIIWCTTNPYIKYYSIAHYLQNYLIYFECTWWLCIYSSWGLFGPTNWRLLHKKMVKLTKYYRWHNWDVVCDMKYVKKY